MPLDYVVTYRAENHYDTLVNRAVWQFLIIPEDNDSQELVSVDFENSLGVPVQHSVNGLGFTTLQLHPNVPFSDVRFRATFKVMKQEVNPFDFIPLEDPSGGYRQIESLELKAQFEPFLRVTPYTRLPDDRQELYIFDREISVFDNLLALNQWVYRHLFFQSGITHIDTTLKEVIESRQGVCQDFTHLFCGLARRNQIPVRYVSGYLHQGNGYFGDSQMHAWAEAYVPGVGWIGFDPTNDILAGSNHIKVAHGKDYGDCSPLKGVIFAPGNNRTSHSVEVTAQQAQQ